MAVLASPTDVRGPEAIILVLRYDEWTTYLDIETGAVSYRLPSMTIPGRHYRVTEDNCNCPDQKYRPWVNCKHRLATRLASELARDDDSPCAF